jgi:meso-butanediol dehydrogenase/(S,S)-butanediol dehydrogenase/diacetyl reductase
VTARSAGRFEGKVAVVTGAASGIGAATAVRFAHEGAAVVVADINEAGASSVANTIDAAGGRALAVAVDVANPADIDGMVHVATEAFGRLDYLHNNATVIEISPIETLTLEAWQRMLAVNLTATFLAIKAAIPAMRRTGGGAIVNSASVSGFAGDWGLAGYNAAKAGVMNVTRTAAIELARFAIRVNAVCPGVIDTPLLGAVLHGAPVVPHWVAAGARRMPTVDEAARFRARTEAAHALGRLGRPEEIAAVVCFLCSEEASFITGASIVADGGLMAQTRIPDPRPAPGGPIGS